MEREDFLKRLDEAKVEYLERVRTDFMTFVQPVFDGFPEMDSFGFRAYEEYFNDGEETEYSVYADIDEYGLYINGYSMGYDYSQDDEDEEPNNCFEYFPKRENETDLWAKFGVQFDYKDRKHIGDSKMLRKIKKVNAFIRSIDNEVWKIVVGDHVIARITRDSIEIKSFNHN